MSNLILTVHQRIETLKQVVKEKSKAVERAPKGVVNIAVVGKYARYYYKEAPEAKEKIYLRKENQKKISQLCQKDYDQKVLRAAQNELQLLEQLLNRYPQISYEEIYGHLHVARKKLVVPVVETDEDFVKAWQQVEYPRKEFSENSPEYYTDREERVRSKTEILIANALNKHNIPYRYEYPLYLHGYGTIYPDFTILNVRQRKEMIWEHFGMMDDMDYSQKALNKINLYEKNDIFPGTDLILTHETSATPINSRSIEQTILHYLQ